jgi:hypothetical protein
MKITKKKLRKLITEEKQSAKEYRKYGFKGPAKDESRHARYLKRKLRYLK